MEVLTMSDTTSAEEVTGTSESQEKTQGKMYTEEEFNNHMAGLKASLTRKFEKQFSDIGDIDELKQLKTQSEAKKLEDAKKRGEFEKVLQELATKKDDEIKKRDHMIREFKIDVPLVNAAAKFKSVNPDQVKSLLRSNIRLNDESEVEVVDENNEVRYDDSGKPISVDSLVQDFLQKNPHFVNAGSTTTNTASSNPNGRARDGSFDLSKLDLTRPDHRKLYAEARRAGQL